MKTPDRIVLDDAATSRLRANVVTLVAILLADQGLTVEWLNDGRHATCALEVSAPRERARVVVHVDRVIA